MPTLTLRRTAGAALAVTLAGCLAAEDGGGAGAGTPMYPSTDATVAGDDAGGGTPADGATPPSGPDAQVFPPFDPPDELTVATYNVENLFDLVDDPSHDEGEFTPAPGVWDAPRVASRLDRLARVFHEIGADVVSVNEVENVDILTQLRDTIRQAGGPNYPYLAVANGRDPRGIKVSVMSRYPILKSFGRPINLRYTCESTETHQPVTLDGSNPEARPIFQIELNVDADPEEDLILLANHWKAKGRDSYPCADEEHRVRSGQQLRQVMLDLLAEDPHRNVMALGDFNSFEFERPLKDGVQASLDLASNADVFDAWGDAGVTAAHTRNDNRWNNVTNSSYNFSGDWTRIDHLLLTPPLLSGANGWQLERGSVTSVHPAFALKNGKPDAWDGRDGSGFSDHLPVRLKLRATH